MPFAKGNIPWNTGKYLSNEIRAKMSASKKGKPPNNKGRIPWNVGISPSAETRYKIGSANRGKPFSEERKKAMSEIRIGKSGLWNKGRVRSEESKAKQSASSKGKPGHPCSEETKEKLRKALTGRILSPERRKSISEGHKGLIKSPELCAKISAIHTGMKYSEETKNKLKEIWKNRPEEHKKRIVKQMLTSSTPNKKEIQLTDLLDNLYPGEWRFVGDGQVVMGGKCPDFINVNGQKKIIELFGDYWHRGENPQDRVDLFSPFGFETLVIWERELKNMESVKSKIQDFHERSKA